MRVLRRARAGVGVTASTMSARIEYRVIPGHEGYVVGSDAVVRSLKRPGRPLWVLAARIDRGGYAYVQVSHGGRNVQLYVHRAVCAAFRGSPSPELEVRHLDGDKTNNALDNLVWGTSAENTADRFAHGAIAVGNRNGKSKITVDEAKRMISMRAQGSTYRALAAVFGLSPQAVQQICLGYRRRYLQEGCGHVG